MSHWYKINLKAFLYNTALSAQLSCLASHSLYWMDIFLSKPLLT